VEAGIALGIIKRLLKSEKQEIPLDIAIEDINLSIKSSRRFEASLKLSLLLLVILEVGAKEQQRHIRYLLKSAKKVID
jgi:hypothetical protein